MRERMPSMFWRMYKLLYSLKMPKKNVVKFVLLVESHANGDANTFNVKKNAMNCVNDLVVMSLAHEN